MYFTLRTLLFMTVEKEKALTGHGVRATVSSRTVMIILEDIPTNPRLLKPCQVKQSLVNHEGTIEYH